jgi:hypothetical protein
MSFDCFPVAAFIASAPSGRPSQQAIMKIVGLVVTIVALAAALSIAQERRAQDPGGYVADSTLNAGALNASVITFGLG